MEEHKNSISIIPCNKQVLIDIVILGHGFTIKAFGSKTRPPPPTFTESTMHLLVQPPLPQSSSANPLKHASPEKMNQQCYMQSAPIHHAEIFKSHKIIDNSTYKSSYPCHNIGILWSHQSLGRLRLCSSQNTVKIQTDGPKDFRCWHWWIRLRLSST